MNGKGKGGRGKGEKSNDPKDTPEALTKLVPKEFRCFICGGEHSLNKHPGITKAQMNTLWDKYYAAKDKATHSSVRYPRNWLIPRMLKWKMNSHPNSRC